MNVLETSLSGLEIIEPKVFGDQRGYFLEIWNRRRYAEVGIDVDFVQDNLSLSRSGVVRGLHYQHPETQGKTLAGGFPSARSSPPAAGRKKCSPAGHNSVRAALLRRARRRETFQTWFAAYLLRRAPAARLRYSR